MRFPYSHRQVAVGPEQCDQLRPDCFIIFYNQYFLHKFKRTLPFHHHLNLVYMISDTVNRLIYRKFFRMIFAKIKDAGQGTGIWCLAPRSDFISKGAVLTTASHTVQFNSHINSKLAVYFKN